MSATVERLAFRASSLRDCPRKAVYEATGAPARDRTPREERFLYRGKSIGRDYVIFLASSNGWKVWVDSGPDYWVPPDLRAATAGEAGIVAEKKVAWGYGTGHADAYITSTRTVVECLSSASASDAMVRSKLLQAVLYTEHDSDATNCRLVVIDPSDFSEEQVVLDPRSRQYAALVDEMKERVETLALWHDTGVLPDRVCGKPNEAIGHFCQHAAHCFDGWEPPELDVVECDETLAATLADFDRAKRARADLAKQEKQLKAEQDAAQEILEGLDLPVGTVRLGPFQVTRTFTQRKPTFQWEKAEMAGVFEPGLYDDFFKPGSSYSTFKTERVDPSGDEFGEVPWEDGEEGSL